MYVCIYVCIYSNHFRFFVRAPRARAAPHPPPPPRPPLHLSPSYRRQAYDKQHSLPCRFDSFDPVSCSDFRFCGLLPQGGSQVKEFADGIVPLLSFGVCRSYERTRVPNFRIKVANLRAFHGVHCAAARSFVCRVCVCVFRPMPLFLRVAALEDNLRKVYSVVAMEGGVHMNSIGPAIESQLDSVPLR